MLVLGGAAEDVWSDEQSASSGNTELLGCRNVCPDQVFPIFLIRYWVLQVVFVSSPSLVYMAHALCRLRVLEKERQREEAQLRGELEGAELDTFAGGRRLEQALSQLRQRKPIKLHSGEPGFAPTPYTFSLALLLKLVLPGRDRTFYRDFL